MQPLRHNHQVGEEHKYEKLVVFRALITQRCFATLITISMRLHAVAFATRLRSRLAKPDWRERYSFIEHCSMDIVNESDQVDRAISTGKLHALPHFHTRPINVVVFHGSDREYSFLGGFPA